jgi:hypothetical protein
MMGHRWWLQALRTVIGPMIMSSFRCEAFGNSVTLGMGTNRPRNTSFTYIFATRRAGLHRVVVMLDVDDEAFEHAGHLRGHLFRELLELAGLDEGGDVVVGVKPLLF